MNTKKPAIVPKKDKDRFNVDTKYPNIQKHHYHIYIKLCAKYGIDKRGMRRVNTEMLKILGMTVTPENRVWCRNKFRSANPTSPRFKQEYKPYYKNEIVTESSIYLSSAKSALVNDEALLDDFLEEYELDDCADLIGQLTPYEKSKFLIELLKYRPENISSQGQIYILAQAQAASLSTDGDRHRVRDNTDDVEGQDTLDGTDNG